MTRERTLAAGAQETVFVDEPELFASALVGVARVHHALKKTVKKRETAED